MIKGKPRGALERGALEAAQQHIVGDAAVEGKLERLVLRRIHGRCLPQVAPGKRVGAVSRLVGGLCSVFAQRVDGGRRDVQLAAQREDDGDGASRERASGGKRCQAARGMPQLFSAAMRQPPGNGQATAHGGVAEPEQRGGGAQGDHDQERYGRGA